MKTPSIIQLPRVPVPMDATLSTYLQQLQAALEIVLRSVYADLRYGRSQFEVRSTVPSASTMDEGQIVIYDNAVDTRRIYVKANGVVRYATLT